MEEITHFHTYKTHTKLRWKKRALLSVLVDEFATRSESYYIEAIKCGVITVNKKIVDPSYRLSDLDTIYHTVHFHEPPVPKIEKIADEGDYVVINKPAGIPVHPTGGYCKYTVTTALFPDQKVGCVNRLDMPVSGVLIIVRNDHNRYYELLRTAQKIYVAKVKGHFPDTAEVNEPIGTEKGRVHQISRDGKDSRTLFDRLEYKDGYSLVRCQPITGRTHQIRIHLQFLGFPIVNDILYGGAELGLVSAASSANGCDVDISGLEDEQMYECIKRNCKGRNNRTFQIKESVICLHAWKYSYNGKVYEAEWPAWATL